MQVRPGPMLEVMERSHGIRPLGDPFARFRREHRGVLTRLDALERVARLERPTPASERLVRETVDHLERQFATHMAAEDAVLFPAVADSFPESRETLVPLTIEHETLRSMLAALRETLARPRGRTRHEQLVVQTRDLVDLLRIHIHKEEIVVFALAERVLRPRGVRD
ncbi:MAG: hemerythrin domain-containing protein, partial [Candidatus Eisenbacteria bacterium]